MCSVQRLNIVIVKLKVGHSYMLLLLKKDGKVQA